MKRVFIIVLDSMGVGAMPDAGLWQDEGSNTLGTIRKHPAFCCPNLTRLGLFNIEGVGGAVREPQGSFARLAERSMGKDTTTGHWEIAGLVSPQPMPTYPDGFPEEILEPFRRETGRGVLCNKPYSGTDVIRDYGREHRRTGDLIVYTSADSVFQIAAHEETVPVEELYRCCRIARRLLQGKHGVGRVIARPFEGEWPYRRTSRRHDFSLEPTGTTLLDCLSGDGLDVLSVGKIIDIFAERGITKYVRMNGNEDGMNKTIAYAREDFHGLCFTNLVDFDSEYGHRNDIAGYAAAMSAFDRQLGELLPLLKKEDLLILTADHGCDPGTPSTDHSREYVPMIAYGAPVKAGVDLGTRASFADISATVLEYLEADRRDTSGESFLPQILRDDVRLIGEAVKAREASYAPYSGFRVGAALLDSTGKVWRGCNIENSSYSVTNCAERTALFKAVSEGARDFAGIAVIGGRESLLPRCVPCGVCLQALSEFCSPEMPVYLGTPEQIEHFSLADLLPVSFGAADLAT
ncbi:MAG: phosphopentomutase [Lachnospiraceae bacterium]|nr:phosphopentomutase [Lachnospiraceae bacterium]